MKYNKKLNSNGCNLYLYIWMNVFQYNRRKIKPQMSRKVNDLSCLYYFDLDTNKVKCDLKGLQFIKVMILTSKRYALFVETQLFEKTYWNPSQLFYENDFSYHKYWITFSKTQYTQSNTYMKWEHQVISLDIKGPGLVYFWSKINNCWNYHLNLLWWMAIEYLT